MENEQSTTDFDTRCNILAELWIDHRDNEELSDFIDYNDLGLPLGFLLGEGITTATEKARVIVNETFDLLLASLGIEEDHGFDSLDDLLVG